MTDSISGEPPPPAQRAATPGPGITPPPPPPPPGSPVPLTRSTTDRYIAGVCGGLGAHFHVDPLIFRLVFAVLTFAGGIGVILYIAAWVLVPKAGSGHTIGGDALAFMDRRNTKVLIAGLIAVLAVVLFTNSLHFAHQGAVWGVALVGVGVLLLVQERRQSVTGFQPTPMPDPPYGARAFTTAAATNAAPAWTSVPSPRPRSILGLVTVAAALLAVGVAALLDSTGVVSVSVATGLAIALIIVGAGLVAGSRFGRSRLLIALGILLLPFTAAATLVNEPLTGGTGNVVVTPQRLSDLQGQYHLAAGQLTVDLSQLPLSAGHNVSVTVALGQLTVVVPPQTNVNVTAHAGAGHIDLFGVADDGVNIDTSSSRSPSPGGGTLHLALSVGFGEVDVVSSTGTPGQGQ